MALKVCRSRLESFRSSDQFDQPSALKSIANVLNVEIEDNAMDSLDTWPALHIIWRGTTLMPHQPAAIVQMVAMLDSTPQDSLLRGGTGLGKTTEALAVIDILQDMSITEQLDELGPQGQHKPVLVALPPAALTAWRRDIRSRFTENEGLGRNINVVLFMAKEAQAAGLEDFSAEALQKFVLALDSSDHHTSRTIILGTYQSFQKKLLDSSLIVPRKPPSQKKGKRRWP